MPQKHAPYPYFELVAAGVTGLEIEALADRLADEWGFRQGKSLDEVCAKAGVDIEYSHDPNEILLEVPRDGRPVIWLPKRARKRDDRVTIAQGLGHWSLHVERTRAAHPGCGVQALYRPTSDAAAAEAMGFGLAFLMPKGAFVDAWYEGRSQAAADRFDVPTQAAYLRAEALEIGAVG